MKKQNTIVNSFLKVAKIDSRLEIKKSSNLFVRQSYSSSSLE